jgi:alkylhydroperoxidase family enzyme
MRRHSLIHKARGNEVTQRLQGVSDEAATGVASLAVEGSTELLGRASNLVRIMANHSPYLASWFGGFVAAVRQPNLGAVSDVRHRNLATIKTSMTNECAYCTAHTSIFGQTMGLSEDELAAMQSDAYRDSPAFSDRDKAAIAWAEAVTRNTAPREKALWEEMKRLFSDAEIVEITLASAMFNMINRLNDTFWTELEAPEYNRRQGNAIHGLTVSDIEAYASRFAPVGEAARASAGTETA